MSQNKLAVLIDADNAQAQTSHLVLTELAKYGIADVKRAYGDWTNPQLSSWKKPLLEESILPIQQFAYTKGKNATDMSMVIDAMDFLHSGRFHGFCLVSSDSDFTRLASRIRKSGLLVYGCGRRQTPDAFVSACTTFIYIENLAPVSHAEELVDSFPKTTVISRQSNKANFAKNCLCAAVEATADENGWAALCNVGNLIVKSHPDFAPSNYGFRKLSDLIQHDGHFVVADRSSKTGQSSVLHVRKKD